jgi:subtilisin family serine protease
MRLGAATVATAALGIALGAASGAAGAPSVLAKLPAGADARDVARDAGVTLARSFPRIGWAEFEVPPGDAADARERLLDDPRVFRLDYQRRGESLETEVVPADPYTTRPPVFSVGGLRTDYHWQQARFFEAWDLGRASARTRVAVIDSEIDIAHPDIAPKVAAAYNAERQHPATYRTPDVRASDAQIAGVGVGDNDLHGSHVAGLAAAATDNGVGVSGAGFAASLMAVKVTLTVPAGPSGDATFVGNAVEGIVWAADSGAEVLNMSFGTTTYHQALADAVAYAAGRDVLLVAAAGNTQDDPAGAGAALYPAALPGVLAVGATGPGGAIAPYSTNGAYVDVAAPGSRILSTWDTRASGVPIDGQPAPGYQLLSGTSMAAPIAAGLGALVRDLRPGLTAAQAGGVITATAADRGAPGRDPAYGAGVIDAEAALRAAAIAVSVPPDPAAPAAALGRGPSALRTGTRVRYRCTVGGRTVPMAAARRLAVARGARLVCRGRTTPALGRVGLQVQRLLKGRWTRIGSFPTRADGRFGFVVRLTSAGPWAVRARLPRTATHAAAAGAAARVAVATRS